MASERHKFTSAEAVDLADALSLAPGAYRVANAGTVTVRWFISADAPALGDRHGHAIRMDRETSITLAANDKLWAWARKAGGVVVATAQ